MTMPINGSGWTWTDPAPDGLGTWSFGVLSSSSAQATDQMVWQRNFQMELQPIPSSQMPLLFEGMATPVVLTLSGLMLSQVQYSTMVAFYLLEHTTVMVDDRGVSRTIFPSGLTITRIKSTLYPYKASYQLVAYLIGQPVVP
jgi:hypothetical protein